MVRLFVVTSHIGTLYMLSYARSTNKSGYKDILVIDTPPKKNTLLKVMVDTQKIYPWAKIINLSTVMPEDYDFKLSTRKSLTQKLKNKFYIKPFYDFLLNIYLKKKQGEEAKIISSKLSSSEEVVEINVLTQTIINGALFSLYPKARVNYLEHGIGDYLLVQKIKPGNFNFYGVFADSFKKYLEKENLPNSYVHKLDAEEFNILAAAVIDNDPHAEKIKSALQVEGKIALILLENVHVYNVPDNYWTDYLDLCISQISNPEEFTFILKPHQIQSPRSLEMSKDHMINTRKLNTLVIDSNNSSNYCVEVLYSLWQNKATHVFTVFSSGVFYISKLYVSNHTKYYYAYDFFKEYTHNSLPQLLKNIQ